MTIYLTIGLVLAVCLFVLMAYVSLKYRRELAQEISNDFHSPAAAFWLFAIIMFALTILIWPLVWVFLIATAYKVYKEESDQ